jgi:transposase-like protein
LNDQSPTPKKAVGVSLAASGRARTSRNSVPALAAIAKLVFHLFGALLAEFEREVLRERTKAELLSARARGLTGGRPRRLDKKQAAMAVALLADPNRNVADICRTLGVSCSTLYRLRPSLPLSAEASKRQEGERSGCTEAVYKIKEQKGTVTHKANRHPSYNFPTSEIPPLPRRPDLLARTNTSVLHASRG